jgi:hypothetical protein
MLLTRRHCNCGHLLCTQEGTVFDIRYRGMRAVVSCAALRIDCPRCKRIHHMHLGGPR